MQHKDKQKRAPKCSNLVSLDRLNFIFLQSIVMGAKESETLISTSNLGHCHLLLRLCLPKFPCIFTLWNLNDCDVTNIGFELNRFKLKYFKLIPSWLQLLAILLIVVLILIFKVLLFFFLLVVTNGYPLGHDLDCHLPSPLFWLELLTILLVVILIFEVLLLFFSWL